MVRRLIIYTLLVLCADIAVAQQQTLTLDECRTMAIESSYRLKSSGEKFLIAEDILAAQRSNNLPNISLSANYLYSTASLAASITGGYLPIFVDGVMSQNSFAYMPDQSYELEVASMFNAGVQLTQPIYLGRRVNNAIKLARIGVDVSKFEQKRSEAEVLQIVDNAFFKVIELEEMLLSAQKYEIVVEEFHRQIESAQRQGMKNRNDVMKVGVRLNEAKLLTQKAMNGLRLAKMNLCYSVGLPLSTADLSLTAPTPNTQVLDDEDLDISARPEYSMLHSQVEAKELEAQITRGEFLPSLSAIASYGYTHGGKLNGSTLTSSASLSGGVMLSVPIFHWGEGRRKTSAKRREVTIAQNQMEDMSQLMSLELLKAINTYNESILEVHITAEAVAQAEENMRLSNNQYNAGMETIADYLESQALWQKAMSDHCTANAQQRVAYTEYLRCRGSL